MRKLMWRGIMIFAAIVGFLGVSGFLGFYMPYPTDSYKHDSDSSYSVYVISNGVHTSFLVPRKTCFSWDKTLDYSLFRNPHFHFLIFGWGEREFYRNTPTWDEFNSMDGVRALFFSEASAMHVSVKGFTKVPSDAVELKLSEKRCKTLMGYLNSSFELDKNFQAKSMFKGYGVDDHFFHSPLHYSLFQTCNTWTAVGLREIDAPTPLWSATAGAVMYHLEKE